ncbi:stage II sporulation protein R [Paenibacillus sambharensis]|uniref:Stage II sporulation protein R n=1 Tax=Paenibacillus sambharensis TaxID=1803190 RepID=A0A2W1LGG4_9BACL|nr:stage II sporulation protein R [Paenibacillus sambharensis]PZD97769.1 stage II sporulation protein R [Paenibacillus sambharensis]
MVIRNHIISFPVRYRASYGYLILALMLLVMSWESLKSDAALASGAIPEESIRLRILANSDSPADQAVKRHVRDAVVADMERYTAGMSSIEEARQVIGGRLDEIETLVRQELAERGFTYAVHAELAEVPFPTKMYGSRVYPAGDYEALRITLGAGEGQNWWCVLFPPLCFVDAVSGEATDGPAVAASAAAVQGASGEQEGAETAAVQSGEEPEVKFFLWEMLQAIGDFFRNLFG